MKRLALCGALAATFSFGASAYATEVLVNGNLEASASPPSWLVETSITGQPTLSVNAFEQIGGGFDVDGSGLGLFVRPFAGNVGAYADQNYATNFTMSQTVNATAGRTYTFSGFANFSGDGDPLTNDGYSGGVDFMLPGSPSDPDSTGTVPSPTTTTLKIEFLNAANAVVGAPVTKELHDVAGQLNDSTWINQSVVGVAPAGATKARVSIAALDMLDNFSFQDLRLDDFSLKDSFLPTLERLTNGNLDALGPPAGYEIVQTAGPGDPLIGYRDFANNTPGGQQGVWLRSFVGGDAEVRQTLAAVPGGEYTFSAFSKWELGYAGGLGDPAVDTYIRLDFLDASSAVVGSSTLDLVTAGQANDGVWREYSLAATAPAGATQVRIAAGATGMYNSGFDPQSAFFDDFSLDLAGAPVVTGDFNGDGKVDNGDLDLLLGNWGSATVPPAWTNGFVTPVDNGELDALLGNWGFGTATAVPEPASLALVALGMIGAAGRRRD